MSSSSITRDSNSHETTTSSSNARSRYSFRRNQRRSDSVVKRTVSSRNRNARTPRSRSICAADSISTSQAAGRSQRASVDAEENNSHDDRSAMERSDDETDASIRAYRERRAMNQTASVVHHFDRVDEQEYLCKICYKVRIA